MTYPTTYLLPDENDKNTVDGFNVQQLQKDKYPDESEYMSEKIVVIYNTNWQNVLK